MAVKTQKELVFSILEKLHSFHITDDSKYSERWIAGKIDDINAVILDDYQKQGLPLDAFYQEVCCITIDCRQQSCVIDGVTVKTGDVIWYATLPNLNQKIGWKNIKYLGLPDIGTNGSLSEFTRLTHDGFKSVRGRPWTAYETYFAIVAQEARFINLPTSGMKKICGLLILAQPTSACNWNDTTMAYPTPNPDKLVTLVIKDILSTISIPKDEINDQRDAPMQIQQDNNKGQ